MLMILLLVMPWWYYCLRCVDNVTNCIALTIYSLLMLHSIQSLHHLDNVLTGDPVICVLIIGRKTSNWSIHAGIDFQMEFHKIKTLMRLFQDLESISLELLCLNLKINSSSYHKMIHECPNHVQHPAWIIIDHRSLLTHSKENCHKIICSH